MQIQNPFLRRREERALRPFNLAGQILRPPQDAGNFMSWFPGGANVTQASAGSLPAVTAAVRLIAETVASLPLHVYTGTQAAKRRADSSPQYDLLNNRPNPEQSAFDFVCDVAAAVEWCGNAFVQKVKLAGQIVELWPLDPNIVAVHRDGNGDKVFQIRTADGNVVTLDGSDIIHVRGFSATGGVAGVSPITLFRDALGAELSMQSFVGNFFANHAAPGVVLVYPQSITKQQAKEATELWNSQHSGPGNQHKTAALGAGADVKTIPISLNDAQFLQERQFGTREIARMWRVPASLLEGGEAVQRITTEQEALNFLNFSLLPRLSRIERAFKADLDLFGDGTMYPQFYTDEFLRTDAATRAAVDHQLVQSGILLVDEARANRGLPPLPNGAGQIPQIVPVGGSPIGVNPDVLAAIDANKSSPNDDKTSK